ncbi:histidine phosphatase family protein [Candidatus Uhrbacteria bacterium]|nr:histidine phosphatase family protein [Candidatus Uhrbacteria bacterium]
MKLFIVRHGETEENRNGILQGQGMGTLSALGLEQIRKLAGRFAQERFDAIYSSDITRARKTAEEIAKHHPNTPLTITRQLREVNIGAFSGKHKDSVDWNNLPPDFEHDHQLVDRASQFIQSLMPQHFGQSILCVAHGRINAALLSVLLEKPHSWIDEIENLGNTSVNVLEREHTGAWRMDLFNDTGHLNDL